MTSSQILKSLHPDYLPDTLFTVQEFLDGLEMALEAKEPPKFEEGRLPVTVDPSHTKIEYKDGKTFITNTSPEAGKVKIERK